VNEVKRQLVVGQYYWEIGEDGHRSGNIIKLKKLVTERARVIVDILNKHAGRTFTDREVPARNLSLNHEVKPDDLAKLKGKFFRLYEELRQAVEVF